ncbi:ROK family protein [Aerococcus sanguinicola]|uniref:ROK family protein n=1 Tax=unclassified Aerococcus TaxID=2618060 RepID=UPI0008A129B1|nr:MULTISPECIES: ROK family protein [unclassified Aerococcus]KAB0647384.1 ROK family protein [Aerococcus sanguinicola]MDK6233152.1 ROK family protein [Aerococcus sp. UMB10185]MDK6855641.1 ROK family protein [Aerococcus sp. UMB7533]MDK8502416.1 ROK family protein [Aerococcus sp. UMB1112A]OFN00331.1 hypothetical protein HMPREF2626_09625 [Aerococcus sp. HMSC062A02]
MKILAIDIGGTTIKSDLYDALGQSLGHFREEATAVSIEDQTNGILDQVLALVDDYQASVGGLDGVAISSAGVIDSQAGKVIYSGYTIPAYQGTDFRLAIEEGRGLPLSILNDVNAAAYGEFWQGDYDTEASLICLTIGTGVGGAVLIDGKIHFGRQFSAGEVGYLPVGSDRFQDIASTTALCRNYAAMTGQDQVTGREVFAAYQRGDDKADQAIRQFTEALAQGLLPMVYLLNPDAIILGGGVMAQSAILLPRIEQALAERIESDFFLPEKIVAAGLGNEAGRLGAVYHFLQEHPGLSK